MCLIKKTDVQLNKRYITNDDLTIMGIMKTIITTVIILKSIMIEMVMVMIIVIIMRPWMLKLLYIYTWKVFRSFCYIFWNLEFDWISMRFTMKTDFLKMFSKAFQKLLLLTGRKWQDSVGTKFRSEWEISVNIGEWLGHFHKHCSIFWSCL